MRVKANQNQYTALCWWGQATGLGMVKFPQSGKWDKWACHRLPANCITKYCLLFMEWGAFVFRKKSFPSVRGRPGCVNQDTWVLFPSTWLCCLLLAAERQIFHITSKGRTEEEENYIKHYSTEILGVKINEICNHEQLLHFATAHKSAL